MNKNRKRVAVKQEMQNRAEDLKSIAEPVSYTHL